MSAPECSSLRTPAQRSDDDRYIAEYLEIAKQKFGEGNPAIILMAMHECLLLDRPIPEWLRQAFIEAYQSATAFEIRSWDEAFGRPPAKGTHPKTRKQYAELRYPVALGVALRASDEKIDKGLFDKIGCELGISGTTASDIYYKHGGKDLHGMIAPLLPYLWEKMNSGKN
jgi:hypothetical protein